MLLWLLLLLLLLVVIVVVGGCCCTPILQLRHGHPVILGAILGSQKANICKYMQIYANICKYIASSVDEMTQGRRKLSEYLISVMLLTKISVYD